MSDTIFWGQNSKVYVQVLPCGDLLILANVVLGRNYVRTMFWEDYA